MKECLQSNALVRNYLPAFSHILVHNYFIGQERKKIQMLKLIIFLSIRTTFTPLKLNLEKPEH